MKKVLILGAAGKDFHVFNSCYRDDPETRVVGFTATQIPNIENRRYPSLLAGPRYPDGIPIHPEEDMEELIRTQGVNRVVFCYSDVSYEYVAARRAIAERAGATFAEAPVDEAMLESSVPVVAVCAVRTGCGKSQTTRHVTRILRGKGRRVVAVRHPMPYGDLVAQEVQRFEKIEDLSAQHCTVEEMEEYEPHLSSGCVVYAGVDYEKILRQAEKEADVIVWDGGNNDTPFFRPTVWITVLDPFRVGHELIYYPGRINFERADILIINKVDTADPTNVRILQDRAAQHNPRALVVRARSPFSLQGGEALRGARVLVVEDGPTVTHGNMPFGAATLAAKQCGAAELIDPRPYLVGSLKETFEKYPDIGRLLPAMGYGSAQLADLEATINAVPCDAVAIGTPVDLMRIIHINRPSVRVTYELEEEGDGLAPVLDRL